MNNHAVKVIPQNDELDEIVDGLSRREKMISPKYFYDERGSQLFEAITRLPEYYPTETELGIMRANIDEIAELVPHAADQPMVIYQEWGTYDLRSPHEAWDMAEGNRQLWSLLRDRGYRPTGGEQPHGFGWACWKSQTDDWLQALFPKS